MSNVVDIILAKLVYKSTKHKYNTNNPFTPNISEIIPGFLYLSNIMLLQHKKFLGGAKIKYILSIVTDSVYAAIQDDIKGQINVKHIPLEDVSDADISKYFLEAHEFIGMAEAFNMFTPAQHNSYCGFILEEARANNCKILVHCEGGISRSPTIVVSHR